MVARVKIILHFGFHKTGTTSLQQFLMKNRNVLTSYATCYFEEDLPQVAALARKYGKIPFFWNRRKYRKELRKFLLGIEDSQTIVVSCEALGGIMPGYNTFPLKRVVSYIPIARKLMEDFYEALQKKFGDTADVYCLFTTRSSDTWVKSVYEHICRSKNLNEKFTDFINSFPQLPNLEHDAELIASGIPNVTVMVAPLEIYSKKAFGPATAVLELLNIPESTYKKLKNTEPQNVGKYQKVEN